MPNRMISLERNTNETQIDLTLDLDGTDPSCAFFYCDVESGLSDVILVFRIYLSIF